MKKKFWTRITVRATMLSSLFALIICIINVVFNFIISSNQNRLLEQQMLRDSISTAKQFELTNLQLELTRLSYNIDSIVNFGQLDISNKEFALLSLEAKYKKVENFTRLKLSMFKIYEKLHEKWNNEELKKSHPEYFTPLQLGEGRTYSYTSPLQKNVSLQNAWAKELLEIFENELTNQYLIDNTIAYKYWNEEITWTKYIIYSSDKEMKGDSTFIYDFDDSFKKIWDGTFKLSKELFDNNMNKTL